MSEIVIYAREGSGYTLLKQMAFLFDDFTCSNFFFYKDNSDELIFFTATELFRFRYMEESDKEETIYTLKKWLLDQPNFGIFSQD